MLVKNSIEDITTIAHRERIENKKIAFIPTMGALHGGHLSMVNQAKELNADVIIMSIFVNPTQFGKHEDFDKYPRSLGLDKEKAEKAGVDILFIPTKETLFPNRFETYIVSLNTATTLEGKSRPTYFQGVETVVLKFFNIIRPHVVFFGQKDAQQYWVINQMVADLNLDINIVLMPTIREKDGLAKSSRNRYLTPSERKDSTVIYKAITIAKESVAKGETDSKSIKELASNILLSKKNVTIDYVEIVDWKTFKPIKTIANPKASLLLAAVFLPSARLIDNTFLA